MKKIILLLVLAVVAITSVWTYTAYRSGALQKAVVTEVSKNLAQEKGGLQVNLIQEILGFTEPKYYLLLFLNNTELRPGGGFIGSYGVIKIDKGMPEILKTDGTEFLDYSSNDAILPEPPQPLKDYLSVKKWYLRDSNWSPDFKLSSEHSLDLYKKEGGSEADKISGVIGFTPTIIAELLKFTGPVKVGTLELNDKNFLEQVQYQVEYGYGEQGLPRRERKDILGDLAKVVLDKVKIDFILHWSKYYDLWQKMVTQKQIMMYATDPSLQTAFADAKWSGEMRPSAGDYLLWVDANLGALKTDWILKRDLSYNIRPATSGQFIATAKMHYEHEGSFDWRTTRYRTYARVYVPAGSKLIKAVGAMKTDRSTVPGTVDQGVENGRQWFGAFIAIEPGKIGELTFEYYLPPSVVDQIKNGDYSLLVQKQLGTVATNLTLNQDFGREVTAAWPGEGADKHGDTHYDKKMDLTMDNEFEIKLK